LANTDNNDFIYVNRMARISGSNAFLAATQTGIFKTTDGGTSWNEVSHFDTNGRGFVDLKVDPTNPNHLLAYHFGDGNIEVVNMHISTPANLTGNYPVIPAAFGPEIPDSGVSGEIILVADDTNPTDDGCETIQNDINGKIALIERGSCNFTVKVINAQNAGAIAVAVFNNVADELFTMGGDDPDINIPAMMITKGLGDRIKASIAPVQVNIQIDEEVQLNNFVMRSTNGGDFWAILDNHGLPDLDVERMEIAFGSDGKTYIAASTVPEEVDNQQTPGTLGLYRSTGAGNTQFEKTDSDTNFIERQGWYDLAIAVNPDDSNHVIMGAVDQYATHDGGTTIDRKTWWFSRSGFLAQYIHADHHGYFFSPHSSDHIYTASDGGISKSEDGGESWFHRNNGLNISQSYGIAVSPDGQQVTSGTQDNGSQLFFGDQQAWLEWQGGDGGFSGWDQQQGQYVYGSYVEGQLYGSNNGGYSAQAMELPDTEGARFIQPFVLD
ncbi:MAG: hypothetical protein KDI92_16205, partial [Xanthomonadales bacterium]|nr:hypothetical protein [Xanthomonadales bacterium]